eukprot:CAMPEP_0197627722 /NCGR_PEP_ID=MMETSP1338-20131121/6256_1 /TAXON_ID=43686 ORGANISM="Pelagodinium beii, Strain RCC1491" /NCGR_SAMPLE_ID=MMETSP1338 /ASSEMBLY_ACC=CAM_ASM_000754 /LENGTH=200 /DNA_ID=CAMNT_0043198521 /DNA_START=41 /DNA_END=640 /DNA_ORIENTATION=+
MSHPSEHDMENTRTDYQRIADAQLLASPAMTWTWTGKPWTHSDTNRAKEISDGCGITPRAIGKHDQRVNEQPVTSRFAMQYATMAISAHGGHTPRKRNVDDNIARLRREARMWHQHDHMRSTAAKKELRSIQAAGVSSAHLAYLSTHAAQRTGVDDRPPWMREDEHLPGGWDFTPSDPTGDPSRFGRTSHLTTSFRIKPG